MNADTGRRSRCRPASVRWSTRWTCARAVFQDYCGRHCRQANASFIGKLEGLALSDVFAVGFL